MKAFNARKTPKEFRKFVKKTGKLSLGKLEVGIHLCMYLVTEKGKTWVVYYNPENKKEKIMKCYFK